MYKRLNVLRTTLLSLLLISIFLSSFFLLTKSFASGNAPIIGSAVSVNTSNSIFFTSESNGANVVISDPDPDNENKRTISGYAWSEDIGWIKFTQGETPGVYVDYDTGGVSGSAYVLNTGNVLDFDNYGSDVIVDPTTGVIDGYVWSEDIGWINFGDDVYVKDSLPPRNPTTVRLYTDDSRVREISIREGGLYGMLEPYIEWDPAEDPSTESHGYQSSDISGYYVYWGTSSTALPTSSGEYQEENYISLPVSGTETYYLRVQSIDNHGNIYTNEDNDYTLLRYDMDLNAPTNVKYIVTPNGSFGNIGEMFFSWPSSNGITSTDDNGVVGWQYSINDTNSWTGPDFNNNLSIQYLPLTGSTYTYNFNTEVDSAKINVGNNIIYFRTVDVAGNFSTYVTGVISYGGQAPTFSSESSVTISPGTSTSNSFSLSWPEASVFEDRSVSSYYYMVNTVPPATYDTLISNNSLYIPVNSNSVSTRTLRGAVKGENIVYVVAVDSENGYSSSSKISGTFTLNSTFPDPVKNLALVDISLKEVSLWRSSLNWDEPDYKGDGNLTYTIQRSRDGSSWQSIGTTQGTSYTDNLSANGLYYYQVLTTDGTVQSQNAPTLSVAVNEVIEGRYTEAPDLVSGISLTDIGTRKATVSWSTERESDTKIMYGLASGEYFEEEAYTSKQVTDHEINLNNLQPDTIYFLKAKWTDDDGNTGISNEVSFRTSPTPQIYSAEIERVGLDYALLNFEVYGAVKATILYGKGLTYSSLKETNTSPSRSKYSVILSGLDDGSAYNYKINLTDSDGYIYDSIENKSFSTPARPKISSVRVQEQRDVASPTVMFSWSTNTPVNSIVRYRLNTNNSKEMDKIVMKYVKGVHELSISGLLPSTEYIAYVEGIDEYGNKAVSEGVRFTTASDTRPPKIFNVVVEQDLLSRTAQTDRSRSAQLIVSWETDEPATSKIDYGEGGSGVYTASSKTDQELRTKHLVVISGLAPSKVYSLQINSGDTSGNVGKYGPVVSITPKSNNTVLETVVGSISNIFKIF